MTVVAARLKFSAEPPTFDPAFFLPTFEMACMLDPSLLEFKGPETGKPLPPPAKQEGVRSEILAVLRAWESSGRLAFVPASSCPAGVRMKLQAVIKDDVYDRLICNRQRRNYHEHRLLGCSADLPAASALTDLVLAPGGRRYDHGLRFT